MKQNIKINVSNCLYFFSYILILLYWYMNRVTGIESILQVFKIVGIICLLINCIIQSRKYRKIEIFKIIFLVFLGCITYYISKSDIILIFILMLLSIKNIEIDKLIKLDMIVKLFLIVILFLLSKAGMTNEYPVYRNGIKRYSYGFQHPNIFGFVVASMWIDFVYLYKGKINVLNIVLMIVSILFIDYYCDSRSSGVLLIMVLLICMCKKEWLKSFFNNKIVKIIVVNSWLVFSVLTLISSYLYYKNTEVGMRLNKLFTMRLYNNVEFYKKYRLSLFGNNLIFVSTEFSRINGIKSAILDSVYAHYLLRYGIILYVMIYYYLRKFYKWAYANEKFVLIGILFSFLLYSCIENRFNQFVYMFLIGKIIYKPKKDEID